MRVMINEFFVNYFDDETECHGGKFGALGEEITVFD